MTFSFARGAVGCIASALLGGAFLLSAIVVS